jgi:hypothetical protein
VTGTSPKCLGRVSKYLIQKDFFQLKELEKLGPKLKGIGMILEFATNWNASRVRHGFTKFPSR